MRTYVYIDGFNVLNDAWLDKYDCAVVVSNDSDLAESLRLVKEQQNKMIGLIFPSTNRRRHPSKALSDHANFTKSINFVGSEKVYIIKIRAYP